MPKRTGDFNAWHLEKLSDPEIAANYLNTVWKDSRDLFLDAVKDVIQARQVSAVAKKVGVQRESLYRSFSSIAGNPTWTTMQAVLGAVGVEFPGIQAIGSSSASGPASRRSAGTRKRRGGRRKTSGTNYRQLTLPLFDAIPAPAASGAPGMALLQYDTRIAENQSISQEMVVLPGFFLQQQQRGAGALPTYAPLGG